MAGGGDIPERGKKAAGQGRLLRAACWGVKEVLEGSSGNACTMPFSFTATQA